MVFLDRTTDNEFFEALEQGMKKTASFEGNLRDSRIQKVSEHLEMAEHCLAQAGMVKEAQMVAVLREVCDDPATEGLTPEKMLANLETKGWVFNADDHDPDSCAADDCAYCSEGKEPQLSQDELKSLRKMLSSDESDAMDSDAKEGLEEMFEDMEGADRKEMLKRLNEKFQKYCDEQCNEPRIYSGLFCFYNNSLYIMGSDSLK